ncbi:MAG TPA: hypothetical protein DGP39_08320 [Verrucomicrobiales bacterium]|nr:hypothetical protein [Verrucomicrobiales bacterium]|tara:strand:- start:26 stop:1822 length:1797 start_codon:yes stop_codon:yes gene_type:complete
MQSEIFVSYARQDEMEVLAVVDAIRSHGYKVWIDQEGIQGAKLWSQEIVHAIEECKIFILFASANSFDSKNVAKELALASESEKQILPIFIDESSVPAEMKYQLAGIQHLVHNLSQPQRTIEAILKTLDSAKVQSSEEKVPTKAESKPAPAPAGAGFGSKMFLAFFAALVLVGAFFLFKGEEKNKPNNPSKAASEKKFKSTIDLCVVTVRDSTADGTVSTENRQLRSSLFDKLTLFRDYKIILGEPISPDADSTVLKQLAAKMDAEYVIQVSIENEGQKVNTRLVAGGNGQVFWTRSMVPEDFDSNGSFVDAVTSRIAGNVVGYAGIIHREVLRGALVKKEEDLTPMELLQIGKSIWELEEKDNTRRAREYLEKCIKLNPDIATAHAVLMDVYLEDIRKQYNEVSNAHEKAKAAQARSVELDPKNAIGLIGDMWMAWHDKNMVKAKVAIDRALDANPHDPFITASAGAFYARTGEDPELGKKYVEQAIGNSETPQSWYYHALVHYHLGKGELDKALENQLKHGTAHYHSKLWAISIYWLNNEEKQAVELVKEIKRNRPDFDLSEFQRLMNTYQTDLKTFDLLSKAMMDALAGYDHGLK